MSNYKTLETIFVFSDKWHKIRQYDIYNKKKLTKL